MTSRWIVFPLIAVFYSLARPASADIPIPERDALVALYGSTSGSSHNQLPMKHRSELTWEL